MAQRTQLTISIAVAGHCPEMARRCVKHVVRYGIGGMRVFVVGNAASGETLNAVRGYPVELIEHAENLGVTRAINECYREGCHLLSLNSDCFVGPGVIQKLLDALRAGWGAVCPLSSDKGAASIAKHLKPTPTGSLERINESLPADQIIQDSEIPFHCAMMNRDTIEEIGLLDEGYSDGLLADNLWCWNAVKRGWKVGIHTGAYVEHLHGATFRQMKMNRKKMLKAAIKKGKEKGDVKMRGNRAYPK